MAKQRNKKKNPSAAPKVPHNDSQVEIVTYNKPQRKQRTFTNGSLEKQGSECEANVKQLKLDVYRLLARSATASGSKDTSSKNALAIALGAEPPKRKMVNYKQLQEDLRQKRKLEQQNDVLKKISSVSLTKKQDNNRRRSNGADKEKNLSGFGKWKGGILRLSKDDVHRIKTTKALKIS